MWFTVTGIHLPALRAIWDTDNPNLQGYVPLILALPGLSDTHTRNSEIHLTVSQYSLAGCEPKTVLVATTDTVGEAWSRLKVHSMHLGV